MNRWTDKIVESHPFKAPGRKALRCILGTLAALAGLLFGILSLFVLVVCVLPEFLRLFRHHPPANVVGV